ncbi:N-acetylglucosamine-6-phosphate deacetylase [Kribbella steppae]|uniref:N-acetylglucosamine-6-phosphate deacetylase n=1 Tax=Kribbella steppae TaxID=2512223 RepID=A0A4R2HX70_9ACTN|nr:amidohydrolase family protein [Kribbella steppae]TCO35917.1 N-acetylglucosamine-6-phosphate deacetylase [Kribbella steppae]
MALIGRDPWSGQILRLEYADGRVTAVHRESGDADLPWISPGLVDLQVNGYGGFDLNGDDLDIATVVGLREALRAVGVTTFVPTLVTASADRISHAVAVVAEARRRHPEVAQAIPFVHLEGPHISDQDGPRGCHDATFVRPPDLAEFEQCQQAADGLIGLITLSPHWPGSAEFIAAVRSTGTRVAVGHTHADTAQIRAAVDAGATLSTHLGNGAHAQLPRHPNYLWAQLADDRLSAGFIADGHHLPVEAFVAMVRAKGLDRAFLVSDSVAIGGRPPGEYSTAVGGDVELTDDGRLLVRGTPYLAGAAAPLADGVAWAAAAFSLPEALTMATANPGRIVGGTVGQLCPGVPVSSVITFHWSHIDGNLSEITVGALA